MDFIKRHKLMCGVFMFDIIAILIVVLVLIYNGAKTATLEVYVAPIAAKIELNGKEYENFKSYDVIPGEYNVVISMDGMQTEEYSLVVEEDGLSRIRTFLLDNDGGFGYYQKHYDDELILETIANTPESKEFVAKYKKVREILDDLPIDYSAYSEDYSDYERYEIIQDERKDCKKMICLKIIDYTGGNDKAAIEKIREMGYEPDDYEIVYELNLNESVRTNDG